MSISSLSSQVLRVKGGQRLKQQQRRPWAPRPAHLPQVLVAMVPSASWQHSLQPQFLSCGQQQERRKNVCILMAAGSLNAMSWKNKEKM